MVLRTMRAALLLPLCLCASSLFAQSSGETVLTSTDGAVKLSGTLQGVENNFYVIETAEGVYRVHIKAYSCTGNCPEGIVAAAPVDAATASTEVASTATEVSGDTARFAIHGSRTIGTNLVPNLLKGYAASIGATFEIVERAPAEKTITLTKDGQLIAEIDLQTKGSGSAFPALGDGLAELGMADRRMNDKDLEALAKGGIGDLRETENEIVLGLDGIVTVVNPANPLSEISFEDLSRIYSGEVTNWSQINGQDLPITLHSWPDGSGDRSIFLSRAVEPFGKTESEAAVEHKEYAEIPAAVLADPGAIGYVGRSFVGDQVKVLPIREACGLVSPPTNFRMKTEGYALSRRIYLYKRPGELSAFAQALVDFAFTPEGQKIIVETGFVDRLLESQRLADMSVEIEHAKGEPDFNATAFDDMTATMSQAERLSIAFRFAFGKSALDPLSERKLAAFAAELAAGSYAGREIVVAGFADSVGKFSDNKRLAQKRADLVASLLKDALGDAAKDVKISPVSYGELLPYLCEEDDFGRDANRRVEIWVR
jgi:phosphate transport system substrate-binding protein